MITAREPRRSTRRHVPAAVAAALTLVGVILIVVASCSSQSGAPQPTAAQSGTIDNSNTLSVTLPTGTTVSSAESPEAASPDAGTATPETFAPTSAPTSAPAAPAPVQAATPPPPPAPPATAGLILPAAQPIALTIPAIGASSALLNLGLNPDNTVEVPPVDERDSKAGWFNESPTPGAIGPAIVVGHIDSAKYGPGIFYNLGKLKPGDTVEITRDDNTVAIFSVDAVRVYSKADFPTREVYGNLDHAGLRLITCGGAFNSDTGHYEDNTIAFATLISSRAA